MGNDEQAIRALAERWLDAVARRDLAAITAFYAPDGKFLFPNAPIAEGRDAISAIWARLLELPNAALTFGPTLVEVAGAGDMAYEVGTYRLAYDAGAAG